MSAFLATAVAMVAFAANSLLCRMALGDGLIDPVSFTTLRLAGGALTLVPLSRLVADSGAPSKLQGSWFSGVALFVYAAGFSLAYLTLTTGTGALILFFAVQVSMISFALWSGERLGNIQWIGLAIALGGLVYLLSPGLTAPDPLGALLMTISGIAWGIYSVRGRKARNPIAMTAGNFARSAPVALAFSVLFVSTTNIEPAGIVLALVSGSVTSGLGYAIWYHAMPSLTTSQASIVQLSVPVLAAVAGITFLAERPTLRLAVAGLVILGGIALQSKKVTQARNG
jgi:drug/metabolite transporter (DMT)-like permease